MHFIYLHGFCSGPTTFKGNYFREQFARHGLTLSTPDLNGDDFSRLTLSSQLAIARAEIDACHGPVTLIGSSMGGYIATLIAQDHPRVEQLILIAPAFRFLHRFVELIGPAAHERWRTTGWMTIEHYQYQEERPLHYRIIEDAEQYENVPLDRDVPALLFHGLFDDAVPYGSSIDYLRHNSRAELVLFPSDHSLNAEIERIWRHLLSGFDLI